MTRAVDGFRLAYDRNGSGPAVVLLHGWPGDRTDFHAVGPLLADRADVVVPDLRGFGESDKHEAPPADAYSAAAQARGVAGLVEQLDLDHPVLAGYDVGSRVAQVLAAARPDLVGALVVTPPVPGIGDRVLSPTAQREFWYQNFHQLDLAVDLLDGRAGAVRRYLRHFWSHWSGPEFTLTDERLDHLTRRYAAPGAFTASISWYRAGAGTLARALTETAPRPENRLPIPTTILWPGSDPLFPTDWADRVDEFFAAATVRVLDGVGHYVPLEAPQQFAGAVTSRLRP